MKTQRQQSNLKREYYYPKPQLQVRLNKKKLKTGKSKSLIVCEILEKHL